MNKVYVSITGLRPHGPRALPAFWWHTVMSFAQARRAPGNLRAEGRLIDGVYHTLTAWTDRQSMLQFLARGAHLRAMKRFRSLGTGRTYGYVADTIPDWDTACRLWHLHGREA